MKITFTNSKNSTLTVNGLKLGISGVKFELNATEDSLEFNNTEDLDIKFLGKEERKRVHDHNPITNPFKHF